MSKWVIPAAVGAAFGVYYLMNRRNGPVGNVQTQALQAAQATTSTPPATVANNPTNAPFVMQTPVLRGATSAYQRAAPAAMPPTPLSNPPPAGTAPGGTALGVKDYATAAAATAGAAAAAAGCSATGIGAVAAPVCGAIGGYVGTQAVNLGSKAYDAASSWVSGLF